MTRRRRAEVPSFMLRPLDRGAEALPDDLAVSPFPSPPRAATSKAERFPQGKRGQRNAPDAGEGRDDASSLSAPEERFVSATQVAAIFGRTPRTLWTWEQQGILVPVRINTRRFYRFSDIEALLQRGSADL